jgi:hypothetical protein
MPPTIRGLSVVFLLYSGLAIAQQPGVLSFNYVTTPLNIPCGPPNTNPAEWGSYTTVRDNHESRVQVRFRSAAFKYDNDTYQVTYQFRNGYSLPVRFEAVLQEVGGTGPGGETVDYVLQPGASSNISGAFSICRQMVSVQMKNIYVGGQAVPSPPSSQKQQGSTRPSIPNSEQPDAGHSPSTIVFPGDGGNKTNGGGSSGTSCAGSGAACLTILAVRTGTRCGSPRSVEVDVRNDSDQYLRGYVIFDTPGHKTYAPTDVMSPGQVEKSTEFVCNANSSAVDRIANVGSSPENVKYPPKPTE